MIEKMILPVNELAKRLFVDSYTLVMKHDKMIDFSKTETNPRRFKKYRRDSIRNKFRRNKINALEFSLGAASAIATGVITAGILPVAAFILKKIGLPVGRWVWRSGQHYGNASTAITRAKIKVTGGNVTPVYDSRLVAEQLTEQIHHDKKLFTHLRHFFNHKHGGNITTYVNLVILMRGYYEEFKEQYTLVKEKSITNLKCADLIDAQQLSFAYFKNCRNTLDMASCFTACFRYVEGEVLKAERDFDRVLGCDSKKAKALGLSSYVGSRMRLYFKIYDSIYLRHAEHYPTDGTMDVGKIRAISYFKNLEPDERAKAENAYFVHQYYHHSVLAQIMMGTNAHEIRLSPRDEGVSWFAVFRNLLNIEENSHFWHRVNGVLESDATAKPTGVGSRKVRAGSELGKRGGSYIGSAVARSLPGATDRVYLSLDEFSKAFGKKANPMSHLWSPARQGINIAGVLTTVSLIALRACNTSRNITRLIETEDLYNTTLSHSAKDYRRLQVLRTNMKKGLLEGWQKAFLAYKEADTNLVKGLATRRRNFPITGLFVKRHMKLLELLWYHRYMKEFYEEVVQKMDRMTVRWMIMTNGLVDHTDKFMNWHADREGCDGVFCYHPSNNFSNTLRDLSHQSIMENGARSKHESKILAKIEKKRSSILTEWEKYKFFSSENQDDIMAQFKHEENWRERL